MGIEFVDADASHVPAIRAFFRRVYRPDYPLAGSAALFDWQFRHSPGAAGYCCSLALVDGEIAGFLGHVPVEVTICGRQVRGAWTANWLVNPDERRLGIGPLLMKDLTRRFDVTLVVGLSQDARAILPRMGFTDLGDLVRYVHVLDREAARALTADGTLDWPEDETSSRSVDPFTSVRRVSRFNDAATALWDDVSAGRMCGTRRSAAFLNWRYAEHPAFEYRQFEARRGSALTGLAVYRLETVSGVSTRVGRLVEFVARPGDAGALLDAIVSDARTCGASVLDFFCARSEMSPFPRCGFLPGDHPAVCQIPILFQPIDRRRSAIPFMAYLNNVAIHHHGLEWHVTKGDGDQDRPNTFPFEVFHGEDLPRDAGAA